MTTETTTALAPRDLSTALLPRNFDEAEKIATKLSESVLIPDHFQKKPADIFWAISYGAELGLSPAAALRGIYVVHGKPGLYADTMIAVVLGSGLCEYFRCIESTPQRAVFETKRRGDSGPVRKEFTMTMAEKAGFAKQNKKYESEPERMLEARCKSWLARLVYPDILHGVYTPEELETIDLVETSPGSYSPPPPPPVSSPPPASTPDSPSAPVSPTPGAETPRESAPADAVIDVESEPVDRDVKPDNAEPVDELEREIADIEKQIRHAGHEPEKFSQDEMKALFTRGAKLPPGPDRDRLSALFNKAEKAWREAHA